jgi:hypothetical protein
MRFSNRLQNEKRAANLISLDCTCVSKVRPKPGDSRILFGTPNWV